MGKIKVRKKHEGSIWNPKNLQREVHAFGYNFHWKTYMLTLLCVLSLMVAVAVFFRLKLPYVASVTAIVLFALPILIRDMYKRMYEQKRFSDAADYMEQILYSFRKEHKVLLALKESYDAMPEGMLKSYVKDAIAYIEHGEAKTEEGVLSEALQLIEMPYACEKIHTVHELLIDAEERGGAVERSIELLIEDIEVWKRQVYQLQQEKKICHIDSILSIIMAALICGIDMYVMNSVKGMLHAGDDISIFQMTSVQISSFVFLLLCLYTFYKSSKKLTDDWLKRDLGGEKTLLKSYEYLEMYDEHKEQKKSILLALPFLLATLPCYLWLSKMGSIICLLIGGFLAVQHKISYSMSMKEVKAAIYVAFPQWMMDMALLLQTNNVQVAIAESESRAETVLKKELAELSARIGEEPERIWSYSLFCEKYNIPEISTCMKMLYSISEAGVGDVQIQIENLVRHVHKLQEKEADLRNADVSFKMRTLCYYPIAGTTLKLLVDMLTATLLIFTLFQYAF